MRTMRNLAMGSVAAMVMLGAPSFAFAACTISDDKSEQELAKIEGIDSADFGAVRRDVRELRNAAMVLQRYGKDDQCQQLVSAMNELLRDPKMSSEMRMKSMSSTVPEAKTDATDTTVATKQKSTTAPVAMTMEERNAAAVPFTQRKTVMSSADLIGTDVYGPDNKSVGEIDDVVVSPENKPSYALISYGGFLGMGQEQVVVPVSEIRVSADNYLFVNLTAEQLKGAPKMKRGTADWWTNDIWRTENDNYYKTTN